MLTTAILSSIFGFCVTLSHQSGFTSPNYVVSYGTGQYESNVLWYVGEIKDIVYDISDIAGLDTYTVALWQQSIAGGGAILGPVVNSTTLPNEQSAFSWTVDLYDFDIALSNVFFFWIFNGSASNQGDMDVPNVSSAYFNITADDPPTATSSTSSFTTSSATSISSASTSSTASVTGSSTQSSQTASSSATTTSTPQASEHSSNEAEDSGGTSTGAGIGIGVGVGLVGVSAVVCAGIIVWYKRRKRDPDRGRTQPDDLHELPPRDNTQLSPKAWHASQTSSTYEALPSYGSETASYAKHGSTISQAFNHGHPAELHSERGWPVELDGDGRDGPRIL